MSIVAELPSFEGGLLRNNSVLIEDLPNNLVPDATDCFCFQDQDQRLAFIQAYYYASRQLAEINTILEKLGFPGVRQIKLRLQQLASGIAPVGATELDGSAVSMAYSRPMFDVSVLAHEIGHAVHFHLLKRSILEFIQFPDESDPTTPFAEIELAENQMGVVEGIAQLSSVLFTGDSRVGEIRLV